MIIKLWDWLFTRKQWTVIQEVEVYEDVSIKYPCAKLYILQDQFGNIKRKKVRF